MSFLRPSAEGSGRRLRHIEAKNLPYALYARRRQSLRSLRSLRMTSHIRFSVIPKSQALMPHLFLEFVVNPAPAVLEEVCTASHSVFTIVTMEPWLDEGKSRDDRQK